MKTIFNLKEKRKKIKLIVITLVYLFSNINSNAQSKWVEVQGSSAYVLLNSLDILDPRNEAEKKRLIILATIEAAKNGVQVSADAILNSPEFIRVIENTNLSEDDYLYRAFEDQNIQWQRLETPSFKQDIENQNKWICKIKGLVKTSNPHLATIPTTPIQNTPTLYNSPNQTQPSSAYVNNNTNEVIQPVTNTKPITDNDGWEKYKYRKFKKKYHFGFNFGTNIFIEQDKLLSNLNITNNENNLDNLPLTFNAGIIFPVGKNTRIGFDYTNSTFNFNNSSNNNLNALIQNNSINLEKLTLHGGRFTLGSYRNAINPVIGFGFNYSETFLEKNKSMEILAPLAVIGFDFGRRGFKFGIEATSTWFQSSTKLNNKEISGKNFDINNFNISVGATIKLIF